MSLRKRIYTLSYSEKNDRIFLKLKGIFDGIKHGRI